jgi:hypothetical protein
VDALKKSLSAPFDHLDDISGMDGAHAEAMGGGTAAKRGSAQICDNEER